MPRRPDPVSTIERLLEEARGDLKPTLQRSAE
jgi:hypothetical protein